jgi:hypothetical protein
MLFGPLMQVTQTDYLRTNLTNSLRYQGSLGIT